MTTIESMARLEFMRNQKLPAPMFWCLHCHRRTVAEWEPFDPATTFPPVPYCPRCGEDYQCGECGFEIDLLGDCQRFKSTGDDTCSTNHYGREQVMAVYNVLVGVIELIEADSPEDAIKRVNKRLRSNGFEPYEEGTDQLPNAMLSEDQEVLDK